MQYSHDSRSLSPITELTTPGSLRTIGLPFDLNPSYESEHEDDSRSPSPAGSAQTVGSGETVTQGGGLHLRGLDPPSSPGDNSPAVQAFDIGRQPSVEPPSLYATPETSPQHTSTISFPKVIIEAIGPYHPSAPAIRPGGLPPPLRPTSGSIKHFTPPPSPNLNPSDEARQRYNDRYGISPGLSAVGAPGDSPSTPERHTGHLEPEPNPGLAGVGAGGSRPGSRPGSIRSRPSSFHARPVIVNRSLSDLALPDLAFVDPILHGGSMPALISAQEDHTLHGIPFLSDESTAEVWQKVNSSRSSLDKGSYSPNGSRVSLDRAAGRSSPRTSRISIGKRSPTKLSVVSLSRPDVRARSRSYQGSREASPKVRPSTYHGGTGIPVTTNDSPLNLHAKSSPIPIPPGRPRVHLRRSDPDLSGLLSFSPSSPSSPSLHRRKTPPVTGGRLECAGYYVMQGSISRVTPPRRRTVSSVFSRIFGADPSNTTVPDQRTPAVGSAHPRKLSKKDRRSGNRTGETVYPLTPPTPTDVDGEGGLGGGELDIPVTAIRTSGTFGIRDDGSEVFIHDNANQSPTISPRGLTHRSRTKSGTGSAKSVGINRVLYVKNMDEPVLEDDESVALPSPPQDQVAVQLTTMASSTGSNEGETFYTPVGTVSPAVSDTQIASTPDLTTGLPTSAISSFDGAVIAPASGAAIGDDEADFGTIKSVHHIRQRSHSHPTVSSALFIPLGAPIPSIQAQRPGTPPPSQGRRGRASSTSSRGKRSDSINSTSSRTRGHGAGVPPSSDLGQPTQPLVQVSPTHLLPETTPHGHLGPPTPPGSATSARYRPLPRPPSSASTPASIAQSSTDVHHSTGHQDVSVQRDLSQYDGPRLHLPPPPEHDPSQSSGLGASNGTARHDEQPAPHPPHHRGMPRQEGQEAKGKRASGTIAPELPALIASHLLSAQAVALMKHLTALREASEAVSQMAKESLDWGGILLNMAKGESPHSPLSPGDSPNAGGHTRSPGPAATQFSKQRTAAEDIEALQASQPTSSRGGAGEDHIDGLPAGAYLPHLPRFIPSQGPPGFSDAPPAKDQLSAHYGYSQGIASDRGHPFNDLYPSANSPDISPSSSTPPHPYAKRSASGPDDGDRLTPIPARPSFTRSQTRLSAKTASTEFAKGHGHDTGRIFSIPDPLPLGKTYELLRHAEDLGADGWEGIRKAELAWREAMQAMRSALAEAETRRGVDAKAVSPSYHGDAVKGPSVEVKQRIPPYEKVPHSFLSRREDMQDSTDGARLRSTGDPGKAQWIPGPHSGIPHSSVATHPSADLREVNSGYTDLHLGLDPVYKVPHKHASQLDKTQNIGPQGSYDSFTSYPASQISGRDSRGRVKSKKLSKSRLGRDVQGSSVSSRRKRVDEVKRVPSPKFASKRGPVASRDGRQGGDTGKRQQGGQGMVMEKVKFYESEYEHRQGPGGSTFRKKHWWSRRVQAAE